MNERWGFTATSRQLCDADAQSFTPGIDAHATVIVSIHVDSLNSIHLDSRKFPVDIRILSGYVLDMPTTTQPKTSLTSSEVSRINKQTGLGWTTIRRLFAEQKRPTNPVIATAWDKAVRQISGVTP